MDIEHSITDYLVELKSGDQDAAKKIWERFLNRLIRLADEKLKSSSRKAMDEEDVVQLVFTQFFAQVQQDKFPQLHNRKDLWQILAMLVDRRAKDQIRKQLTLKAGGGKVLTESAFANSDAAQSQVGIAKVPCRSLPPDLELEFVESFHRRLARLEDVRCRQIALLKMQGFTNREIAKKLKSSVRTIERRLGRIRRAWELI